MRCVASNVHSPEHPRADRSPVCLGPRVPWRSAATRAEISTPLRLDCAAPRSRRYALGATWLRRSVHIIQGLAQTMCRDAALLCCVVAWRGARGSARLCPWRAARGCSNASGAALLPWAPGGTFVARGGLGCKAPAARRCPIFHCPAKYIRISPTIRAKRHAASRLRP